MSGIILCMANDLENRRRTYSRVSNALAHLDNAQLASLFGESDRKHGWGGTHVVTVDGAKVFVKAVPLTDLEFENPYNTRNLYEMPTYYNYGVGSAGLGAYRELVAQIKTTNWVLEGACPNFPLLYHHRVVPFMGEHSPMDDERRRGYIDYWGGDAHIERYIVERGRAGHQIVLCLEHFPNVGYAWLVKKPELWENVIRELTEAAAFMRGQGMVHFDIHFANVVLDESRPYVADFGLATDKSYHLTDVERRFLTKHIDYDLAYIVSAVGSFLYSYYRNTPKRNHARLEKLYGITDNYRIAVAALVENVDAIHDARLIKLDDYYARYVSANRELILLMFKFFVALRDNHRKDTAYPSARVRRLLNPPPV